MVTQSDFDETIACVTNFRVRKQMAEHGEQFEGLICDLAQAVDELRC